MTYRYILTVSPGDEPGSLVVDEQIEVPAGETVSAGDVSDLLLQRTAALNADRTRRVRTMPEIAAIRAARAAESATGPAEA